MNDRLFFDGSSSALMNGDAAGATQHAHSEWRVESWMSRLGTNDRSSSQETKQFAADTENYDKINLRLAVVYSIQIHLCRHQVKVRVQSEQSEETDVHSHELGQCCVLLQGRDQGLCTN